MSQSVSVCESKGCIAALLALSLFLTAAPGCNGVDSPASTHAGSEQATRLPRIVATTGMVTDIVKAVAGEHAEVIGLLGDGVDPHLYNPTRNDVLELSRADIIFYSGLMLEGRMTEVFARIRRSGIPAVAVTEGIDRSYLMQPPEFAGHWDPHVWMDVRAWSECVAYVAERLAKFDPQHADAYRANAEQYRAELSELDAYIRRVIASIPESQRALITAHDAFGYFGRAYDLPVFSVQGISTESEPSVDDVNQLVDLIVSRKVRAIFVETSVSQRNMRAIIEGVASKGWSVKVGGELFSDAMGPAGTYEGTYIGMLDHNATTIARALGGEAPSRGLNGRLGERRSVEAAPRRSAR